MTDARGPSDYVFGGAVRLRVTGAWPARRHFAAEFGPASPTAGAPDVETHVTFGRPGAASGISGGHKTARWRVALSRPEDRPLRASIVLFGGPASFALSLVQGFFVEPLIAVALARAGSVALPSAGLATREGALIILGRSGTGKSSLSMRALADGRPLLGDDQVVVGGDGRCWPYPRRLRVYPDIALTAPQAWARLPTAHRAALVARRAVRRLSRGYVAPSLAVHRSAFDGASVPQPAPLRRLVAITRAAEVEDLAHSDKPADWAEREARDVIAAQRRRFLALADDHWRDELAATLDVEAATFRRAIAGASIEQLRLPRHWDAASAVSRLESCLLRRADGTHGPATS